MRQPPAPASGLRAWESAASDIFRLHRSVEAWLAANPAAAGRASIEAGLLPVKR